MHLAHDHAGLQFHGGHVCKLMRQIQTDADAGSVRTNWRKHKADFPVLAGETAFLLFRVNQTPTTLTIVI